MDSLGVAAITTDEIHNILLTNRNELEITGVEHVSSFDVHTFDLVTTRGMLKIQGTGLHMKHFDMTEHRVRIEGKISGLTYHDERKPKRAVGRIFK